MNKKGVSAIIVLFLFLTGCATVKVYSSKPAIQKVSNDYYEVELESLQAAGYNYFDSFRLVFRNKTDKDLLIDHGATLYLLDGK